MFGCLGECSHDHELDEERGAQFSLYKQIDINNVVCLNEEINGSVKKLFRPYNERYDQLDVIFLIKGSD